MLQRDQLIAAIKCNEAHYKETGDKMWLDRWVGLTQTLVRQDIAALVRK